MKDLKSTVNTFIQVKRRKDFNNEFIVTAGNSGERLRRKHFNPVFIFTAGILLVFVSFIISDLLCQLTFPGTMHLWLCLIDTKVLSNIFLISVKININNSFAESKRGKSQ